jgi:methionine synthase I (cobalamin-dependent)
MTEAAPRPDPGLRTALARGPLVLDAGMGTRLVARGLDLASDDPALRNLTHPEAVADVHARDVAAGADAVLTNTFGANRRWLARFGRADSATEVNRRAVALARQAAGAGAAGRPVFVIGSVGPTASDDPDACRGQAEALLDAGADALLFETHRFDQAVAALQAVRSLVPDATPVWVSLVDWPAPVSEPARRLEDLGAAVLGVNCVPGVRPALATARALAGATWLPLLVKPNAGRPGDPPEGPGAFARAVPALLACGVRLLGGCCGTDERHVAALRAACYDAMFRGSEGVSDRGGGGP